MDKFIVSGTPHVRSKDSIQGIMRDVLIGLTPAALMGIYVFGLNARSEERRVGKECM